MPTGIANTGIRYRVMMRINGGSYNPIAGNLTATNHTINNISSNTTYDFYVIAENNQGQVNISAVYTEVIGDKPSNEIVPSPDVRSIRIEPNGDITITWLPPEDTTGNFENYEFAISETGQNSWTNYPQNPSLVYTDNTITFTGVLGQSRAYTVRARTLSGCTGVVRSNASFTDAIFLDVTAKPDKTGDIDWNLTGINDKGNFNLYKDDINGNMAAQLLLAPLNNTVNTYTDVSNLSACDEPRFYRIWQTDPLTGDSSVSNIASDVFIDNPPPVQPIDYVTVNADHSVTVKWSQPAASDIDSLIIVEDNSPIGFDPKGIAKFFQWN